MEYRAPEDNRGVAPWIWVLIVLLAILLVFVVWWAVAAQSQRTVTVPGPAQPTTPPAQQPAQTTPPQVVERPVTIYIERGQTPSTVYIVPKGQQPPPQATEQVSLPGEFSYAGKNWEPAGQAVPSDSVKLVDTGLQVEGNTIYADEGAQPPYRALYLQTQPGSGVYIKYEPM
ncbi:MAG TPA: hypothetical protein VFI02_21820 [Armatimonadota bacterium]|nr:hypothetical protein [Armatimonadota bacterium]